MEHELSKKKRRRESESLDDDRQVGERRKVKKLRYSRLGEDWGADDSAEDGLEEPQVIEEGSNVCGGGGPIMNLPAPEPGGGEEQKEESIPCITDKFHYSRIFQSDEDHKRGGGQVPGASQDGSTGDWR